jgi:predicted phage baseplate assembly protein
VAENDDTGRAQLRFGDGICGFAPPAGWSFQARYRVGTGAAGNVGREAIVWLALRSESLFGAGLQPRNPLPALGGTDPEPMADVKRYAPHAYGRVLERAVAAADYAQIAGLDARIEGAHAALVWTGSGYEACVALDPRATAMNDPTLAADTLARLQAVRRIGHDVRIVPALYISLSIGLDICVAPGYLTADVELAVLNALSNRVLADGSLGFFHPDTLVFGEDIPASPIIAAVQGIDGVAHLDVTLFARADATPADALASLTNGIVPIAADELPQLDNDPNFPERGTLKLTMRGGK